MKVEERFFKKVQKTEACWLWTASIYGNNGYGAFWNGSRIVAAHRYSFELHKGEILENKIIMHSCDNPVCVNPDHLTQSSQHENIHDMIKKGRANYTKPKRVKEDREICKNGHDLTLENALYISPKNIKVCKRCKSLERLHSVRRWREREKQNGISKESSFKKSSS